MASLKNNWSGSADGNSLSTRALAIYTSPNLGVALGGNEFGRDHLRLALIRTTNISAAYFLC